jgi:hypothetical protein
MATLAEIVEIRRELESPLIRFRGGVMKLSQQIASAPWEPDFEGDVTAAIHREIEPAVADIEEQVRQNPYLPTRSCRGDGEPRSLTDGPSDGHRVGVGLGALAGSERPASADQRGDDTCR